MLKKIEKIRRDWKQVYVVAELIFYIKIPLSKGRLTWLGNDDNASPQDDDSILIMKGNEKKAENIIEIRDENQFLIVWKS